MTQPLRKSPWLLIALMSIGSGCARTNEASAPVPPSVASAVSPPSTVPAPDRDASSGPSVTWFGGNAFRIVTRSGRVIWLDPWIRNPENPTGEEDLANVGGVDLVILTSCFERGAYEDAIAILRKTSARLIAPTRAYSNDCEPTLDRQKTWFPLYGERLVPLANAETPLFDGEVSLYFEPYFSSEGFTQIALRFDGGPTLYDTSEALFHTDGSRDAADPYVFTPCNSRRAAP